MLKSSCYDYLQDEELDKKFDKVKNETEHLKREVFKIVIV